MQKNKETVMSENTKGGIGLKTKLLVPGAMFLIMLVVVVAIYLGSAGEISNLSVRQQAVNDLAGSMRTAAFDVEAFLAGRLDHGALADDFRGLAELQTSAGLETNLEKIQEQLARFDELNSTNAGIEEELDALTASSIKQSDGYIKMVSEKLADETARQEVTTLERLVIIGASINTSSNYELKIRFLKLKENLAVKDSLMSFLDTIISNTAKDIERLADTPFQGMALAAQQANHKAKELTLAYIANVEEQNSIEDSVRQAMIGKMAEIDQAALESNQQFFRKISGYFKLLLVVVIIAVVLGIVSSWLIGRSITGPVLEAMRLAETIRLGDLSQRLSMQRRDEIGQMAAALDAMADGLEVKASLADRIASGDLTRDVALSSEADVLGRALREMDRSLNTVLGQIREGRGTGGLRFGSSVRFQPVPVPGGHRTGGFAGGNNQFHDRNRVPDQDQRRKRGPG